MMELTKEEQIQAIYDLKVGYTLGHDDIAMLKAMSRQLLARMEQDPVAEISQAQEYDIEGNLRHQRDIDYYQDDIDRLPVGAKLYATPQLPQPAVVPSAVKGELTFIDHFERIICERDGDIDIGQLGRGNYDALMLAALDAFRAAMLQGAEPVSQPYTLRDGWVAVPVEPTEEILDEFDSIIDYGAEDSKDAWSRLLAAAWIKSLPAAPQQQS